MGTIADCLKKSGLDANTARYLKRQAKGDPIAVVRDYAAVVDENIAILSEAVKQWRESTATHKKAVSDAISAGRPVSSEAADHYGVTPKGWELVEGRYIPPDADTALEAMIEAEFDKQLGTKKSPTKSVEDAPKQKRTVRKSDSAEPKPAKTNTEQAADKARKEADDLWAEFSKKGSGKLTANLDAELATLAVRIALAEIKAGTLSFAAFVERTASKIPAAMLEKTKPYIEMAWKVAHKRDMTSDPGGKFDDYLNKNEAASVDYGIVDKPSRVELGKHFAKQLADGASYPRIIDARKEAADLIGGMPKNGTQAIKTIDEAIELGVVMVARDIAQDGESDSSIYDDLVDLYERQPNLGTRTSTSMLNQAYSTPAPLAFLVNRQAGITQEDTVYDSSAGNGMLLIVGGKRIANELNPDRVEALQSQGIETTSKDATEFDLGKSITALAINPPFGEVKQEDGSSKQWTVDGVKTDKVDHAITIKSLSEIPDNGKVAIIIGAKGFEQRKSKDDSRRGKAYLSGKAFYDFVYDNYNVTDHYTVDGDLYSRQGAAFPVDVIIIEGRGKSSRPKPYNIIGGGIPKVFESWGELKNAKLLGNIRSTEGGVERGAVEPRQEGVPKETAGGTRQGPEGVRTGARGVGTKDGRNAQGPGQSEELGGSNENADVPRQTESTVGSDKQSSNESRGDKQKPRANNGRNDSRVPGGAKKRDAGVDRLDSEESEVKGDQYQSVYTPSSKSKSVDALIPNNHQTAVQSALDSVEEQYGDIDEFVAKELGVDQDRLHKVFSAEQVDALALAIARHKDGRAFILGDQTGVGKGRVAAGMLIYAKNQGLAPVFFTEKPTLYADIIRDLIDTGFSTDSSPFNPLITNVTAKKSDQIDLPDGRVLKQTAGADERNITEAVGNFLAGKGLVATSKKATKKKASQAETYDAIFTTYNQMVTVNGELKPRHTFLQQLSPRAFYVLDESHNAGGSAQDSDNERPQRADDIKIPVSEMVRNLIENASGVYFSSGTYAKRPSVMDLYAKTGMTAATGQDGDSLASSIAAGGVPLQQIVSQQLVESGAYLRRERSFDGVEFKPQVYDVSTEGAEQSAAIFRAINAFDKIKGRLVEEELEDGITSTGGSIKPDWATGEAGMTSTNFSSILWNLTDQMLLAVKSNVIADEAIASIGRGESPVIYVDATMEAALNAYIESSGLQVGEKSEFSFRDLLQRYLDRSREVLVQRDVADKDSYEQVRLTDEQLGETGLAAFNRAQELIDNFSADLPASPIDWIRKRIEDAGYSFGEYTGRHMVMRYETSDTATVEKRPEDEVGAANRINLIRKFNNGDLDVLLFNRSGSTGVSMHASEKVKNQKPRHMIIGQPSSNIDTFMQSLGRVHRTGQVTLPKFTLAMTSLPSEIRPSSVLVKKLASLNANVTASDKGSVSFDVPDVMNIIGDRIVAEYLAENDELNRALNEGEDEGIVVVGRTGQPRIVPGIARKASGRLAIMPIKTQQEFWDSVTETFADTIAELDRMGANPLSARVADLDAKTVESFPVFDGDPESANVFDRPAYIEKVIAKRPGKPMTPEEITHKVTSFYKLDTSADSKKIAASAGEWIEARRSEAIAASEQRIREIRREGDERGTDQERIIASIDKENQQRKNFAYLTNAFAPGNSVSVWESGPSDGLDVIPGVVLSVERKGKEGNPLSLSKWRVEIAIGSPDRVIRMSLSQLRVASDQNDNSGRNSDSDEDSEDNIKIFPNREIVNERILNDFVESEVSTMETRYIGTGNILAAFNLFREQKGRVTFFQDSDGNLQRGVLLPRRFKIDKWIKDQPIGFDNVNQIQRFLASGSNLQTPDRAMSVMSVRGGLVLRAPKSKARGGKYTLSKVLLDASSPQEFVSIGARMEMVINDPAKQSDVINAILSISGLQATTEKDFARSIKSEGTQQESSDFAKKITKLPPPLYQTDDVDDSIRVQALDIAFAAEDTGITTFDKLVAYSVKAVGERRTREIGAYLEIAANAAGFAGIRQVGDVLGTPGVTKDQAVAVAKAAFPMLSDEQIEANVGIVERLGLLDNIGFTPFGSPVPEKGLFQRSLQTDTPEFKRWFGKSKVVDKEGKPLRLVHGTNAENDFTEFAGRAFAAFGSTDTELTSGYSGENERSRSIPVYFKAEKPAYLELELNDTIVPEDDMWQEKDKPEDWDEEEDGEWEPPNESEGKTTKDELAEYLGMSTDDFSNLYKLALEENKGWYGYPQVWRVINSNAFRKFLEEGGYDSFTATEGGSEVWAVISDTQVKSTTGNRGTFDSSNPNVLMQNQKQSGNVKGWTSFISATRAIIGATDKADVSTFIHEIAHPMRRFLLNREVPQNKRADITDDEILSLENVLGVKNGVWEVEHEEKFAKMWEQYWFDGKPPKNATPELQSLFKKIAKWMLGVYQSIQQITGVQLPVEVRDLFDKLVQRSGDGEFRDTMSQNEMPETTSIKNENANARRAERGVPALADVATQTQQEWLDAANDLLQDDPMLGDRLVKELNHNARNLSNVEVAVMQIYYRQLNNRLEKVSDRLFQAKDAKDAAASAKALLDVDIVMNTLVEMEEATKKAGREWGRAGVARQIELEKDFSLAALLRKARIANGGNALSKKQREDMDALARKVAQLEGDLAKANQVKMDLERQINVKAQIEESKTNGQPVPESIRKKVVDKLNAFKSKFASAFASSGKTGSLFATEDEQMADDAKSVIQEYVDMGISTIGELLSNLRKDLGSDIPVSVKAAFATAWKEMHDNGDIPVPMVDKNDVRGLSRLAKQIERSLVEAGITKLEDVVRGVRESLQEIIPDITERETMDALSGYGQYSPPSENPDDKIIADINGRLLELAKLDDMKNKIAPARTGVGRQELSPEHRELIRKVNIAKRDGKYQVTDPDTQLKSAVSSAKTALVNRIHDLNKAINVTKQPIVSSAKTDLAGKDDGVIALRKERDELMAVYKTMFPKPGATMEQRVEATAKALDRVADSLEKQLKSGDFRTKNKSEPISTEELDAKRAIIDALRAQRAATDGFKEWTDEQKSKAYKANLLKQIADYQDRSLHSFFGPKPKKEARTLSPEEVALKLALQQTKDEFFRLAGLYRLEHMSPRERAWDYVKETAHLSRALMTSFDFSAVFRQGGSVAFSHPMMAAETSKEMYKAMLSEAANFNTAEKIRMDDMYQFAMTAGLSITEEDGKITKQEEAYMGRWAKHGFGAPGTTLNTFSKGLLTPVSASARGYMTFLNGIRFKLFKLMVANLGKGGQVTADEAKVIALYINAATGRSELGPMMKWAEQANMLFFAPRFVASRFQYLGMPLWLLGSKKVSGRVKKAIAMEYIRHSAGVMSFLALTVALGALLAGDDEDEPTVSLDPRSSDFLKIKWGETRIDPMSGLSQVITLMGRIASGQRVGADGKVINLRGEDVPYGGLGMAGTVGNFVRTKFAPVPGAAFDIAAGENVVGQPVTPFSSILNLFIPLSLREINDTAQSRGIPQGALIALLSLHGMGASTYGPESNYRKANEDERKDILKKDLKKMTFDSRGPGYKGLLTAEQKSQVNERLENRKQGLVFEAAANPIRKAFKNDETYKTAVAERDVALGNLKKSGMTLDESRKLLIKHWESQYGSAKEMRGGVRVYKEALSNRLKQLRKEFAQ